MTLKSETVNDVSNFIYHCTKVCDEIKSKHVHCKYCSFKHVDFWNIKRHVLQCHINRAVQFNGKLFYPCKLKHMELGITERYHFHCPICKTTISNTQPFFLLMQRHLLTTDDREANSNKSRAGDRNSEEEQSCNQKTCSTKVDEAKTTKNPFLSKCSICQKSMHPKSMPRRYRRVHFKEMVPSCARVNEQQEIFFLQKRMSGGILYRSHVKNMCNGNCFHSECEDDACTDYMKVAKLSGIPSVECIYLQQCNEGYTIALKQTLSLDSLKDFSEDRQLKLLSDSTISPCGALHKKRQKRNSQIFWLPCMTAKSLFIHFSVLDDGVHYYAKLGRVTVTADMLHEYLDCSCCARRRGCVHKAICKWYLYENKLLNKLLGIMSKVRSRIKFMKMNLTGNVKSKLIHPKILT